MLEREQRNGRVICFCLHWPSVRKFENSSSFSLRHIKGMQVRVRGKVQLVQGSARSEESRFAIPSVPRVLASQL